MVVVVVAVEVEEVEEVEEAVVSIQPKKAVVEVAMMAAQRVVEAARQLGAQLRQGECRVGSTLLSPCGART